MSGMNKLLTAARAWSASAENKRRVLMTVIGVLVCGFGVSLCRMAGFGVDPFQALCSGIYRTFPNVPQGNLYVIINGVLLVAVLLYHRAYVGLGTLVNMFLLGYVADGGERLMRSIFPAVTLPGQVAFLGVAILVLCFSSALYIASDLGVSTYDAVALQLERMKLGSYRWLRICTDLVCVGIGFALGEAPGVCTIITALLLGPLTSFFMRTVAMPLRKTGRVGTKSVK